jgi:endonuclease YncB( thermonuclease family)
MQQWTMQPKRQPKSRAPTVPSTVDGDQFQVVGEEKLYACPVDANKRARKLGRGTTVIRMSDGKVISIVPDHVPPPPREIP